MSNTHGITITITAPGAQEARRIAAELFMPGLNVGSTSPVRDTHVEDATVVEDKPKKKRRGRPPKEDTKPTPEPDSRLAPEPNEDAPTLEKARLALSQLVEATDTSVAVEVLSEFGVERVSDMEPDQYGAFIKVCAGKIDEASG